MKAAVVFMRTLTLSAATAAFYLAATGLSGVLAYVWVGRYL